MTELEAARAALAEMTRERDALENWRCVAHELADQRDAATAEAGALRSALESINETARLSSTGLGLLVSQVADAALSGSAGREAAERMARYESALHVIASTEHWDECEFYELELAPEDARQDPTCTCCDSCRDSANRARAALRPTTEPGKG